jgi:hypothetical protein
LLAETLGRVLVHMSRMPDVRVWTTKRKRKELGTRIEHLVMKMPALGIHLEARAYSVMADLGVAPPMYDRVDSVADFSQADALHAMLNYRHALLRRRASDRNFIDRSEYVAQRDAFASIGADGDAARVPFLPGAETAFTHREVAYALRSVGFTHWHRLRMLLGWELKRAWADAARLERRLRDTARNRGGPWVRL